MNVSTGEIVTNVADVASKAQTEGLRVQAIRLCNRTRWRGHIGSSDGRCVICGFDTHAMVAFEPPPLRYRLDSPDGQVLQMKAQAAWGVKSYRLFKKLRKSKYRDLAPLLKLQGL